MIPFTDRVQQFQEQYGISHHHVLEQQKQREEQEKQKESSPIIKKQAKKEQTQKFEEPSYASQFSDETWQFCAGVIPRHKADNTITKLGGLIPQIGQNIIVAQEKIQQTEKDNLAKGSEVSVKNIIPNPTPKIKTQLGNKKSAIWEH